MIFTQLINKTLVLASWLAAFSIIIVSPDAFASGDPTSLLRPPIPASNPAVPPGAEPATTALGAPAPNNPISGAGNHGGPPAMPGAPSQLTNQASGSATATGNQDLLQGLVTQQQALNATLLSGPRAAAARAQLGIMQAGIKQALVLPNPAIEFDNGYAEQSFRVGIALPIEPPWKVVLRLITAKANVGTAELQVQQSLWFLRSDTRRAYTELVISEEAAVMMRNLASLTRNLADVATKRFQSGDVAKLDAFKAELAFQQADIDASQAERRVIQAREQLNIIMGRNEEGALVVPKLSAFQLRAENGELLPDLSKPLAPLSQYINEALRDRLEIKIIKQQIVAAQAGRKLTKGNIIPNGQIAFGYDRQLNFAPESNVNSMYLMGSFPLPIFDRQQGELARYKAALQQLDLQMVSEQNVIRGQVALAYRKLLNARENIRKYQESVLAQSEKVSDLGRISYKLGQTDITSALNAQQAHIQVRNLYLTEVFNYQQGFTDLEQAVGHVLQ